MRSVFAAFAGVRASAHASSVAEATPTQGLIPVDYTVSATRPTAAELQVDVAGAPALRRPVKLGPEPVLGRFALHGHLLPNGPAEMRVRLVSRGRTLAEHALAVRVANQGAIAEKVAASLQARGAPLAFEGPVDSALYDYADPSLTAWYDRGPAEIEAHLAGLAASGAATSDEIAALSHFAEHGYMVVPDAIDPDHLGRLNAALDDAVARKVEGYVWGESQRLHNLHLDYPAIRELWLHPKVMRMLALVFGEPAKPCQSLTYVFGSEQQHHQDTIHLTPFPAGRMCGVWSALEDVQPDSGELVVFPGSHRAPRVYMKDADVAKVDGDWTEFGEKVVPIWTGLLDAGGWVREVYRPKAGTVLIWHENLMHGGSPRLDRSKSRRSIVGHYFAQGAVVYYDSSGAPGMVHEPEPA